MAIRITMKFLEPVTNELIAEMKLEENEKDVYIH